MWKKVEMTIIEERIQKKLKLVASRLVYERKLVNKVEFSFERKEKTPKMTRRT